MLVALGHLRPPRPGQAEPAVEVPPGGGVPADPRRLGPRRRRAGPPAPADPDDPLRVVDLGCGNAYLTFAAHRFLTEVRGLPVHLTGVDRRAQPRWTDPAIADGGRPRRPASWQGTIDGRRRRAGAGGRARAARLRHRHRRRARAGRGVGGRRWCWPRRAATTTSPPSCAAAPTPAPYADAHPARHPPRAVRRHPDRRAARVAAAAGRATGSTSCSSSRARTRRATPCSGRPGPATRATAGLRAGVRRAGGHLVGAAGPGRPAGAPWRCVRQPRPWWSSSRSVLGLSAGATADDPEPGVPVPGPRDRGVQRAGGAARRPVRHRQRLRRRGAGVHGRPGDRRDRRGDPLGGRGRRRRGAGAGRPRRPSGSATSATTTRSARPVEVVRGAGRRGRAERCRATASTLEYPTGPADAEALLAHPRDGRLVVVTKDVFGGTRLRRAPAARPRATPVTARGSRRRDRRS